MYDRNGRYDFYNYRINDLFEINYVFKKDYVEFLYLEDRERKGHYNAEQYRVYGNEDEIINSIDKILKEKDYLK